MHHKLHTRHNAEYKQNMAKTEANKQNMVNIGHYNKTQQRVNEQQIKYKNTVKLHSLHQPAHYSSTYYTMNNVETTTKYIAKHKL
jgi:flagellar biosynthesis/type III secretory pathway ATPase